MRVSKKLFLQSTVPAVGMGNVTCYKVLTCALPLPPASAALRAREEGEGSCGHVRRNTPPLGPYSRRVNLGRSSRWVSFSFARRRRRLARRRRRRSRRP